jgi:hypothetical protein
MQNMYYGAYTLNAGFSSFYMRQMVGLLLGLLKRFLVVLVIIIVKVIRGLLGNRIAYVPIITSLSTQ